MLSLNTEILIVEDSREDYETTVRALRQSRLSNPIFHCSDGDEALDFLYQRGCYSDATTAPRSSVILLDLNLPGTDGREVLETIKRDDQLKSIPVIVLTTSNDERDIDSCYQIGANSYVHKPVNLAGFMQAIERLADYWFQVAVLPGDPGVH